ncbi:MAG: hypothetical protein QME74_01165 [Candidatus Edwardsbacteria bacterium]|nr:hypothetical protein [Candidatus Edwardsbacteria bacterium]
MAQFLPDYNALAREAVEQAAAFEYAGEPARIVAREYLMAVMVQTGRSKDRERLRQLLEGTHDKVALRDIIARFGLKVKFEKMASTE